MEGAGRSTMTLRQGERLTQRQEYHYTVSNNKCVVSLSGGLIFMMKQNREAGENPAQSRYCNW